MAPPARDRNRSASYGTLGRLMRRTVPFTVLAGALSLAGCSGGGTVLGTSSTPTSVIVTTLGGANVARVLPGGTIPLTATAVSGSQNGALSNDRFVWTATLLTSGTYIANTTGQTRQCAVVDQTIGAATAPLGEDFSIYLTIDPTNEANVYLTPPTIVPAPAGSTLATNYPYCVGVTATVVGGNASGTVVVAVVNPQNPEQ